MNDRLMSLLGLIRKAGKLVIGSDAVLESVKNGKSGLVIITADASEHTKRTVKAKCDNTPIIEIRHSQEDVFKAAGKSGKILSVEDDGFAQSIAALIQEDCLYGNSL